MFGAMTACGAAVGAVHDALRMAMRGGLAHIGDLALGVIAAAGIILTALRLETDAFRWYVFAGVWLGIALYRLTIGTIVRRTSAAVRRIVKKCGLMHKNSDHDAGKQRKSANV